MRTSLPLLVAAFSLLHHRVLTLVDGDLTDNWELAVRWTSTSGEWDYQEQQPLQQHVSTKSVHPTGNYLCPDEDGKDYVTKDGECFRVRCGRRPTTSALKTLKAATRLLGKEK